jgi:transcriptional regulator with XRE-family HTH domain
MGDVLATVVGLGLLNEAIARTENDRGKSWTQLELAGFAKVSERTVRRFLKREEAISEVNARSICQALDVSFEDVVELDKPGQPGQNPFIYGDSVSADRFYERKQMLNLLADRLRKGTSVNLVGLRRSGKTSLLRYLMDNRFKVRLDGAEKTIFVFLDLSTKGCATPLDLVEGLRRGIGKSLGKEPWRREENDDDWIVQEGLEDIRDRGYRVVILMDEFESIEQNLDLFQPWATDWRSKASTSGVFTLVVASQRPLGEFHLNRQWTSPFDNIFTIVQLGSLALEVWGEYVKNGLGSSDLEHLDWIEQMSGGFPCYVEMAASVLWDCKFNYTEADYQFSRLAELQLAGLWRTLTESEKSTLRFAAGLDVLQPSQSDFNRLERYGLVRNGGRIFSIAFKDWILEHGLPGNE